MVTATFRHAPIPAAMRTASAARGLSRGSVLMRNRTPRFIAMCCAPGAGRSIEAEKAICRGDQIAQDGQAAEHGLVAGGQSAALRSVGAGKEFQAGAVEPLQVLVVQAPDRFVDAIEV